MIRGEKYIFRVDNIIFLCQSLPPVLPKMHNENVLLRLPKGIRVGDIRWLAIWCLR